MTISGDNKNSEVKKRGRKAKSQNYFDVREEKAVRMFLTASTWNEKNQIYNEYLRAPLDKMIESIIRRYKLYRKNMDFVDIHNDTHSFLMTKVEKFKPDKNKKAYSYFVLYVKIILWVKLLKTKKNKIEKYRMRILQLS